MGMEMQHDTSSYRIEINGCLRSVIASLLYYRYSKMRYLKFYPSFNRFKMKCFFHEGLTFFGHSAHYCIIDNTNLARLRGSGVNAVMTAEMSQFARQYGFEFICHEIGHANRKAGNERSFYTLESNFFPGRRFESLADLNRQALEWATRKMANVQTLEQMAAQLLKEGNYAMTPATLDVDEDYINREAYIEGCTSDEPDLSEYDRLLEEESSKDEK
jgi:hypothetical protein